MSWEELSKEEKEELSIKILKESDNFLVLGFYPKEELFCYHIEGLSLDRLWEAYNFLGEILDDDIQERIELN